MNRKRRRLMQGIDSNISNSHPQQQRNWKPTALQQKFLNALEHEQRRSISIRELCRKAGVSWKSYDRVRHDEHFMAAVQGLGITVGLQHLGPLSESIHTPTPAEQRLLDVLQEEQRPSISIRELCQKAGVDRSIWYWAIRKPHFVASVAVVKVKVGHYGISHINTSLAPNPEEELEKDIWDLRRLKSDYPKHHSPSDFKVDFTWIGNPVLLRQIKSYFRHHLRWKPKTFAREAWCLKHFFQHLSPEDHIGTLDRTLIEELLPKIMQLPPQTACTCLHRAKAMLDYMATSPAWTDIRPQSFLIWSEDIPSKPATLPRPIPPNVLHEFDMLLEQAIQAIQTSQEIPILSSVYWDAILILRRTGMRFEDLAHLKAPDTQGRNGCLDQDPDGYWWIRLHHKISKMGQAYRIPTKMSDGVVEAIRRQQERIKDIPDHFGEHYLFRTEKGVLTYGSFWNALTNLAPHLMHEGAPYSIAPHQFRHTLATDMIEQGVDIYTVKEFLGHASLAMTERYVKVYLTTLKAKYDAYRLKMQQTYASEIITDQVHVTQLANESDGGWVDGKVGKLYVSPLPNGIGNCAHLAMLDPCPTPPHCPTCMHLRASKCHLPVWENKARNLLITVEVLRSNPRFARAQQKHEQELAHTEKVIETIKQEGFWNGDIHNFPSRHQLVREEKGS
jgi:integrase